MMRRLPSWLQWTVIAALVVLVVFANVLYYRWLRS